jgi:hypothetical protein
VTDNPVNSVLVDNSDVAKATIRSWAKDRVRLRVADADEVAGADYSDAFGLDLNGTAFDRDTSDTTTAADGVTCLVDLVGTRFKIRNVGIQCVLCSASVYEALSPPLDLIYFIPEGYSGITITANNFILLDDAAAYAAITSPDPNTLYVWPST